MPTQPGHTQDPRTRDVERKGTGEAERVKERGDKERERERESEKERKKVIKKIVATCYSEVLVIKPHCSKLLNFLRFDTLDKDGFL